MTVLAYGSVWDALYPLVLDNNGRQDGESGDRTRTAHIYSARVALPKRTAAAILQSER